MKKPNSKPQAVFDKHADILVGDMVEWSGHMCIVTCVLPHRGWEVLIPKFGSKHTVHTWDTTKLKVVPPKTSSTPKE
jgi:hypothetical protein